MAANRFDDSYRGTPPWDIGRPQPAIERLAEGGQLRGRILDVGCGTGEHVLYLAARGFNVSGVDGAPRAIRKARSKAQARGVDPPFEVADALDLPAPVQPFDTVIDSGLFHVFSDDERVRFKGSLERILRAGGRYFMMCFSEHEPGTWGPRRVTQSEIRATFSHGWRVDDIQESAFDTNLGKARAWLASISRTEAADRSG